MRTSFAQRIRLALADTQLRENFRGAMQFLRTKRASVVAHDTAWEQLRKEGEQIREQVLAELPDLLEQLEASCQRNGIEVHWAEDANSANERILAIAQQHNAQHCVKGKSMATEEIGLNDYLARHAVESLETDMGEYIVQLADETPSHIIMPAIHKDKTQISNLFAEQLNEHGDPEDVDRLIGIGRRVLRDKFKRADIGISGVNFAAADSGALCLVENEGNGRMCTTIPPVHIAVMGLEKVIPSLHALPTLQSLLTRSATGQAMTTYLNLISRPRQPGEKDGPHAVHLILLDNGRSHIHQDTDMQRTLACIRCGACMNHCPVYTRIGGHAYGSTYPGPIGQVITPQLEGLETQAPLVSACSLNGACGEACPVNIPLPNLIRRLRERSQQKGFHTSRKERILWALWHQINTRPRIYAFCLFIASRLRWLPGVGPAAWRRTRVFPRPARRSLHARMANRTTSKTGERTP